MEVFRITRVEYAEKLLTSGVANRWNLEGQRVIYAGSSRALSALELMVHRNAVAAAQEHRVMVIGLNVSPNAIKNIAIGDLPTNWRTLAGYPRLQYIGSRWYKFAESLVLRVPSVIIPAEFNYVINANHPDFDSMISLKTTEDYFWDTRLFA